MQCQHCLASLFSLTPRNVQLVPILIYQDLVIEEAENVPPFLLKASVILLIVLLTIFFLRVSACLSQLSLFS